MSLRLVLPLFFALALSAQAGDRLYKWVDENGKVQYSDKPPAQQTQKGHTEMNRRAMPLKQVEGYLTPEQRAAREAEEAQKRVEEQKRTEAKRRDKALTQSFTSTAEIDAIRDRNIEQVEALIQADKQRIETATKRLEGLHKQTERFTKRNRPIPEDIQANIAETEQELVKLNDNLKRRETEIGQIRERAEADKKRLVELKGDTVLKKK
ncbi:DUF4124 domain-containing protein [Chitinimonas lacunae]|uniref:DUF4124 domain-containing protein n=1 Tax=Chitinimonas lacunae TaxID=1963018 RepID=A0ABV8MQA6_9NEIS